MFTGWTDFESALAMVDQLQRRMGRTFAEGDGWRIPASVVSLQGTWPAVNLYDAGNDLLVEVAVPGLTEKDINVTCNRGVLTISGERRPDVPEGYTAHRQERPSARFSRSFSFPCEVDLEHVAATVKDGLLTVKVAKAEQAKPRQITVKAE